MSVRPRSIASSIGLRPDDHLLAVDGRPLRDVLDYRFYTASDTVRLTVRRHDEQWDIGVDTGGADLGLEFSEPTFDSIRRCANNCGFCFLSGLPRGLRRSVYIKDDDYRYSFLYGNFVTLTNLAPEDWERLAEQRLSPLYVSVHATEPALRRTLLHNPRAPHILDQLTELGRLHIQVHTQVVLCPGINDGTHLDRTVHDLASLFPTVQSIGVVPVGLTAHHTKAAEQGIRPFSREDATALLGQVSGWQTRFRMSHGVSLVHAADDLYLISGEPVPSTEMYDEFPQYENGIGMTRSLLDDWAALKRQRRAVKAPRQDATLVCGTAIGPLLGKIAEDLGKRWRCSLDVLPVVNRFFGPTVTVSGLLTGGDIQRQLAAHGRHNLVVLPRSALESSGVRFLDGMELQELSRHLGARIITVDSLAQLARAIAL